MEHKLEGPLKSDWSRLKMYLGKSPLLKTLLPEVT